MLLIPLELDARHVPAPHVAVAEPTRFRFETARRLMRRIVLAVAWLSAAVVLIALGAAGIVAGMDAPATTDAYPWQTARDDVPVGQRLDAITADPEQVSCSSMRSAPRRAARCRRLLPMTMTGPPAPCRWVTVSWPTSRSGPRPSMPSPQFRSSARRRVRTDSVRPCASGMPCSSRRWPSTRDLSRVARLATWSAAAARMSTLLANHDKTALQAAAQGRRANYAEALTILDDADEIIIADARRLRDQLAATVDVETLDDWLDRSADYDKALRDLYAALRKSDGRVDAAVRRAVTAERKARIALPADTRGSRRDHVGHRPGRDERRGHRHRAGTRRDGRRARRIRGQSGAPIELTARSTRSGEDAMPAPVSGRYTAATYR